MPSVLYTNTCTTHNRSTNTNTNTTYDNRIAYLATMRGCIIDKCRYRVHFRLEFDVVVINRCMVVHEVVGIQWVRSCTIDHMCNA
jgi:hypothetical protein